MARTPRPHWASFAAVAAGIGLCAYLATGNLHFTYDDFELYLADVTNPLLPALVAKLGRHARLGAELYNTAVVHLFGLERRALFATAIVWHLLGTGLFGATLATAFPARRTAVGLATALAFAMPVLTATTYIGFLDCARVAMVLAWAGMWALVSWARRPDRLWPLVAAMLAFFASFTVYENGLPLIVVAPLLMLSARGFVLPERRPVVRLAAAVAALATVMAGYRWGLGFVDVAASKYAGLAAGEAMAAFSADFAGHLAEAASVLPGDGWSALAGLATAVATLAVGWPARSDAAPQARRGALAMAAAGTGMALVGLVPYVAAGFTPKPGWDQAVRVYSSASYGIALLLAAPAAVPGLARVVATAAAALAGLWVVHWFELRRDWSAAADAQCRLWSSLFAAVPAVEEGTNFVLIDVPQRLGRIPVVVGSDNIRAFMQLAYKTRDDRRQIYTVFASSTPVSNRLAVTAAGIRTPDMNVDRPLPLDRLVIVERVGDNLQVRDRIGRDAALSIDWTGPDEIATNHALIRSSRPGQPFVERARLLGGRCSG
ncbi:MAG: hypothetical protein ACM31L_14670 [Actinomycetota bacterium]